jgi:hypothetical protein
LSDNARVERVCDKGDRKVDIKTSNEEEDKCLKERERER